MVHSRNIGRGSQNGIRRRGSLLCLVTTILGFALSANFTFAQNKAGKPKSGTGVRVDEKGRKFINNIPFDVFFDNPLEIVSANKNTVAAPDVPVAKTTESKPATPAVASSGKQGDSVWNELLPMEELQGEIKSIRNNLNKSMTNQGTYNSNFKAIAMDGAEMAALAGIVQRHSESLTWKDKAQYARDFGAQLNQSATGLGKDNFEKARAAFQRLCSVLDGSIPADAGDIPDTRPFQEVASRKALMKRIEKAKDMLKQDVNTEAKFKSMSSQVKHEAAIISALATVITTDGYEYTTEDEYQQDEYQQHAKSLIEGAREASSASQDESYDRFKQAVDRVNKSCTDCHATYGNG
jgi:hypothetical protein